MRINYSLLFKIIHWCPYSRWYSGVAQDGGWSLRAPSTWEPSLETSHHAVTELNNATLLGTIVAVLGTLRPKLVGRTESWISSFRSSFIQVLFLRPLTPFLHSLFHHPNPTRPHPRFYAHPQTPPPIHHKPSASVFRKCPCDQKSHEAYLMVMLRYCRGLDLVAICDPSASEDRRLAIEGLNPPSQFSERTPRARCLTCITF